MKNYFIKLLSLGFNPPVSHEEPQRNATITCELTWQTYHLQILVSGPIVVLSGPPARGSMLINVEEMRPLIDALLLDWLPDTGEVLLIEQARVHSARSLLLSTSAETLAHRIWYTLVGTMPDQLSFRICLWEKPTGMQERAVVASYTGD